MRKSLALAPVAVLIAALAATPMASAAGTQFTLKELARLETGLGAGGAEIPTYHAGSKRLFATNGAANTIDIYDMRFPRLASKIRSISLKEYGDGITSVAAGRDVVVAAVSRDPQFSSSGVPTARNGVLVVMNPQGRVLSSVDLGGVLPDSTSFTPDGLTALVALEGEPICALDDPATTADESKDYGKAMDPEGGIAIVNLRNPANPRLRLVTFENYSVAQLRALGLAMSPVVNNAAKDLEPEYVAAASNTVAYATLQEANGIAEISLKSGRITEISSGNVADLGVVAFDTSDRDNGRGPRNYPGVYALGQPDTVAGFSMGKDTFAVVANEGDAREWTCLTDDTRASALKVDPGAYANWPQWRGNAELGRSKVNPNIGDVDGDGDIDVVHLIGSRSMSIFKNGQLLWDSADLLEQIQVDKLGAANMNGAHELSADGAFVQYLPQARSDDKGAEPEGLAVGMVGDRRIAVLGLERMSALVLFDISNPAKPLYQGWVQMQPTTTTPLITSSAWSPEGVIFIPATTSPNGKPLIVTSYEVSGSLTIHEVLTR